MTKKKATFIFPGGQKYTHALETRISPTMLYNLINIYNPTLVAVGAGIDLLSGAGRAFTDRTLPFIDKETGKKVFITIERIPRRPEHFILVSGGIGFGEIERDEKEKQIRIAEAYIELIRSNRDIIFYGFGCNPGYFKEKDRAGVLKVIVYTLFKVAPRIDDSPIRIYFIAHVGGGSFRTEPEPGGERSGAYFYLAGGWGMSFSKKVYVELLGSFNWNDSIDLPDGSIGLRVGYRLDLF